jgi:hypothetical protein
MQMVSIERVTVAQTEQGEVLTPECSIIIPNQTGHYQTEMGFLYMEICPVKPRDQFIKVIFMGDEIGRKRTLRRVVLFPNKTKLRVIQETSPTQKLIFRGLRKELETNLSRKAGRRRKSVVNFKK